MNSELSITLVQLMKHVGSHSRPTAAEEMYERTKAANLKKVKAQVDTQLKQVTENQKAFTAAAKG